MLRHRCKTPETSGFIDSNRFDKATGFHQLDYIETAMDRQSLLSEVHNLMLGQTLFPPPTSTKW